MHRTLQVPQGVRYVSIALVASLGGVAGIAGEATAIRVPQAQKISAQLDGDCADKLMDESEGDETCNFVIAVTPKSPARTFTFQRAEPGAKKWSTVKSQKVSTGKAIFAIDELDDDGVYLDGKYSYRVTAPAIKGKEKAFISPTLKVDFVPGEAADEASDEFSDDEATTATTAKSTQTTAKPTTGTTTTVTTPAHGGGSTDTTVASGTNGGTPTNTTAPNNEDPNWWGGLAPTMDNLGAYCDSGDPTMYVGATICSSTGIGGRKSVSQFKALIATIANAAPQYKRNGFCTQAMFKFGYSLAQQASKCAEVDAAR